MLHAYAYCTDIDGLEYAHSCTHGPPPHWIKVCVVAKDNEAVVVRALKAMIPMAEP